MEKKILYVITKSNFGGAQRYVYDLATNLKEDGHTVSVALGGTGRKGDAPGLLKEKLKENGISIHCVEHFLRDIHLFSEIRALFELITLFKKEQPDVIHLNSSKAIGIGALAGRIARVPSIVGTIHGWPFYERHRGILFITIAYLGSLLSVWLLHKAIVVSRHDQERSKMPFWIRTKITAIHNGLAPHQKEPRTRARAFLTPHLSPETLLIGSVGELSGNKNYMRALDACRDLKERGHNFHYVILGSGDEHESLKTYIQKNDLATHVTLKGYVKDASRYLAACDIFFMPSLKEGLPYAILEAGNASLPIVASNIGGIPEIITHNETGLLIDPTNTESIADALETLLTEKETRERIGKNIKARIDSDFQLHSMIEKTKEIY